MDLWVVGKCKRGILSILGITQWEFVGIFDSRDSAIMACKDDMYFVGHVILNEIAPERTVEWPGAFYPMRNIDGHNHE